MEPLQVALAAEVETAAAVEAVLAGVGDRVVVPAAGPVEAARAVVAELVVEAVPEAEPAVARVGARALVGAASLVRAGMAIPAEHLAVGNPVTVTRPLDEQTLRWKANGVKVYQELAKRSLASMRETAPLAEIPINRPQLGTGRCVSAPLHELRRSDNPGEPR